MAKFFKKEIPSRPLYLSIGRPLTFEHYDDDFGYLKTDDGYIIDQLMQCIANSSGGVSEVTEEEYLDWLKKKSNGTSSMQLRQRETIGPTGRRRAGFGQVAQPVVTDERTIIGTSNDSPVTDVATPQRSEGLKVERTFMKPRIGKLND
jgi:hypothetical protein